MIEQATSTLGISMATAKRYWTYSRAWLFQQIAGTDHAAPDEPA